MKPIHAAALLLFDHEMDRILLVKKDGPSNKNKKRFGTKKYWMPPGGKIEAGETALEAALREAKQETGMVIPASDVELLYKIEIDSYGSHPNFECTIFLAEKQSGLELNPFVPMEAKASKEILDAKWMDIHKASQMLPRIPSRPASEPLLNYLKHGTRDICWVYGVMGHNEYALSQYKL